MPASPQDGDQISNRTQIPLQMQKEVLFISKAGTSNCEQSSELVWKSELTTGIGYFDAIA